MSFPCSSTRRASRKDGSRWTTGGSCTSKILWYWSSHGLQTPKYASSHEDETCAVQSDGTCVSPLVPLQDAYARGEVFLGCKENSYTVLPGLPQNVQGHHWPFGITIGTPDRKFLFACETEEDQKDWMAALQSVIDRPMLPQEYAGESRAFRFSSLFTWGLNMVFAILPAVEAYFKHKPWTSERFWGAASANRRTRDELQRERETQVYSRSLQKRKNPCFPPLLMHVTHVSVIGVSLNQVVCVCLDVRIKTLCSIVVK